MSYAERNCALHRIMSIDDQTINPLDPADRERVLHAIELARTGTYDTATGETRGECPALDCPFLYLLRLDRKGNVQAVADSADPVVCLEIDPAELAGNQ